MLSLAPNALAGPRQLAGYVVNAYWLSVIEAISITGLLFLGLVVFRKRWLALGVAGLLLLLIDLSGENLGVEVPISLIIAALVLFLVNRYGLLALVACLLYFRMLTFPPLTVDFSRWYAGRSVVVLVMLAVLAGAAFLVSLGGKSPLPVGEDV